MLPSHDSKTPRNGLRFVAPRTRRLSPLLAREEMLASAVMLTATLLTEGCSQCKANGYLTPHIKDA